MLSASEFRKHMEEAQQWAKDARSEEQRALYLRIAETWRQAALKLEESLGLVAESQELVDRTKK